MIRLREIGRPDVAAMLSRTVYHEKAHEAHRAFIDDPFKQLIHTNSPMLVESAQVGPTGAPRTKPAVSVGYVVGVACLSLGIVFLVVVLVVMNCPDICDNIVCESLGRKCYGVSDDVKVADDGTGASKAIHELEETAHLMENETQQNRKHIV